LIRYDELAKYFIYIRILLVNTDHIELLLFTKYGSGEVGGVIGVDTIGLGRYQVNNARFGVVMEETHTLEVILNSH